MEYWGVSDIGLRRSVNQDAVFMAIDGDVGLFCVADGMGGHSHGERASREIVSALELWWKSFQESAYGGEFFRMMRSLSQALEQANRSIYDSVEKGHICGSTVVCLFLYRESYGILYAGDSRIYLSEKRKIKQLTVDETWENQAGLNLRKRAIKQSPNYGKLVNAVGIAENVKISGRTDQAEQGMLFLLCSDGLYKMCPERAIIAAMKRCRKETLHTVVDRMIKRAYQGGARDNVSVILVRV